MADIADDTDRWTYLAEGNATQARKRVAVDVVIRDEDGQILLVDPSYKPYWDLPGGMAEANESPRSAAEREVLEELGIPITVGLLLTVDWVPPRGPWDDQIVFVFDGGALSVDRVSSLRIADDELERFDFFSEGDCTRHLRPDIADRLGRALVALETGAPDYREMK